MKKTIGITAILTLIAMTLLPLVVSAESDSSRINRVRKAIGRELIEVQSANWPSVLQYYTSDIEYHDPIVTIEGMSVIKFRPRETQAYYQRDYYTESDIMINIPGLDEAAEGFRIYYRCAIDPTFDCPFDEGQSGVATTEFPVPFKLNQNVPNPFNPSTEISFEVPAGGADVALRIYDVTGRLVKTLIDGFEPSGIRTVNRNGKDDQGRAQSSGIYFYRMDTPGYSETLRMILLR